ncbi:hypothetical protein BDR26DRAFT_985219 [Obelidium mucronatum]|nr:hypothetical protein BDR26DRAFT_985219 [Obelidium mucronatum]
MSFIDEARAVVVLANEWRKVKPFLHRYKSAVKLYDNNNRMRAICDHISKQFSLTNEKPSVLVAPFSQCHRCTKNLTFSSTQVVVLGMEGLYQAFNTYWPSDENAENTKDCWRHMKLMLQAPCLEIKFKNSLQNLSSVHNDQLTCLQNQHRFQSLYNRLRSLITQHLLNFPVTISQGTLKKPERSSIYCYTSTSAATTKAATASNSTTNI